MKCEVGNKPKCWYIDSVIEETRFSAGWKPSGIGNAFAAKEEAEWMLEHLRLVHEMQEWVKKNDNDFKPDWTDGMQHKFHLGITSDGLDYYRSSIFNFGNIIYFSSKDKIKEAVEHFGEERILKYYFPN